MSESILTDEEVLIIRGHLKEAKLTQKEIGDKFGVSRESISSIKRRNTYRFIY